MVLSSENVPYVRDSAGHSMITFKELSNSQNWTKRFTNGSVINNKNSLSVET
jgi:hypothetical protein